MIGKVKHKYIRELFPDRLPYPYGEKGYPEFDERDTFDLECTIILWLYERLRYFQDVVTKQVVMDDPEWQTFDIDGEQLTQLQCIDRMVEDCKTILLYENWKDIDDVEWPKINAAKDDLFKVFSKVYWQMWW